MKIFQLHPPVEEVHRNVIFGEQRNIQVFDVAKELSGKFKSLEISPYFKIEYFISPGGISMIQDTTKYPRNLRCTINIQRIIKTDIKCIQLPQK